MRWMIQGYLSPEGDLGRNIFSFKNLRKTPFWGQNTCQKNFEPSIQNDGMDVAEKVLQL